MANQENLEATLAAIEQNPQHWDQETWHCGTSHCFSGFAEMLRLGMDVCEVCVEAKPINAASLPGWQWLLDQDATQEWLGLTARQWNRISDSDNTLEGIRQLVAEGVPDSDDED